MGRGIVEEGGEVPFSERLKIQIVRERKEVSLIFTYVR